MWEHPHSHFLTRRYASQHVSQCRSTHITTFQLAVIHHGKATSLSPILLSLKTPVTAHNSRNKRRFPSQHPSQHFRANSHAYQTCQPTDGRADEQRETHIKRQWFQPKDYRKPTLLVSYLESYLNDLQRWLSEWRIAISVTKSTAIIFARSDGALFSPGH